MKPTPIKTAIICSDPNLRNHLAELARHRGHQVIALPSADLCPIHRRLQDCCSQSAPCCDILIVDFDRLWDQGFDFLQAQMSAGCRASIANKGCITIKPPGRAAELITARARELGCAVFSKPDSLAELPAWLEECEQRLNEEMVG
ncbi:MAG: hypothetical protein IH614_04205 [Desulfuromonadales bacterium]|nr:hypothetical protein [Desulfuromonadales bacterium]